jgi:hypothetical protein
MIHFSFGAVNNLNLRCSHNFRSFTQSVDFYEDRSDWSEQAFIDNKNSNWDGTGTISMPQDTFPYLSSAGPG